MHSLSILGLCDFKRAKMSRGKNACCLFSVCTETQTETYGRSTVAASVVRRESVNNMEALVHGSVLSDT